MFNHRKIKEKEFSGFFLKNLQPKPISSKSVIFINFYLVMRLMCYDLCYIALGFLPQVQIIFMISIESVLIAIILRAHLKYRLFDNWFTFLRLFSQSFAIWFWFLVSFAYSFSNVFYMTNGLKAVEAVKPFGRNFDLNIQWMAIFLIFLGLFLEMIHLVFSIVKLIREWWELRRQQKVAE